MKDIFSERFIEALKTHDTVEIRKIPKSDLHNHFVPGGDRKYIGRNFWNHYSSFSWCIDINARHASLE